MFSFCSSHSGRTITSGREVDSCFNVDYGVAIEYPPARRNNLTSETRLAGNQWDAGYLAGEDRCDDWGDFTVDFDDRGLGGIEADGTDWGEDDNMPKCGSVLFPEHGAWFVWVR